MPKFYYMSDYIATQGNTAVSGSTLPFAFNLPEAFEFQYDVSVSTAQRNETYASTALTNDPKIPGTRIPIYRISALLDGGLSEAQVAHDFPSLSLVQIEFAREYARRIPAPPSINYPKESLKRVLLDSGFSSLRKGAVTKRKRG